MSQTTLSIPQYPPERSQSITQDRSQDSDSPEGLYRPGREFPRHLSFTSLSSFSFCAGSWALHRLDRVQSLDHNHQKREVGTATHRVLELMGDGARHDAALLSATGRSGPVVSDVEQMVDMFLRWPPSNPSRPGLVASEVELRSKVAGFQMFAMADAVEWVDGLSTITDYKTSRAPAPTTVVDGEPIHHARVTRQVVLYGIIARASGLPIDRVQMMYPASQTIISVDLNTERGKVLITEAENYVAYEGGRLEKAIRTGHFPFRPANKKCSHCDVSHQCPAFQPEPERSSACSDTWNRTETLVR